jgi:protein-S-isoprenylcysteine O-methyltransferase Ste14
VTPTIAKAAYLLLAGGWYVIRFPYARRASSTRIARSARDGRETALLLISLTGLGLLPISYILAGFPRAADYPFRPAQAWLGAACALLALLLFRLTHRSLGRNWSVSLDVREHHQLITGGIYSRIRHPMYTAFWMWAIAQALLLPNWVAGPSGLVGFGVLYFGRVGREERLMLETFGDDYRTYISRTARLLPRLYSQPRGVPRRQHRPRAKL